MQYGRLILRLLTVAIALGVVGWKAGITDKDSPYFEAEFPKDIPSVRGTLRVSTYGQAPVSEAPLRHVTTFVNGPSYTGMEDTEVRGFLDGNFKWAWNQAGRTHACIGRRIKSPRFGEHELIRLLHRWDDIRLPEHATVLNARIRLVMKEGPEWPEHVLLYAVMKDWLPGSGGVERNNYSPPAEGEVWWRDRAFPDVPWGLPGCGFASDVHPGADTAEMPLADAHYVPGADHLTFSSSALAHYVQERLAEGKPLLLLFKLSDYAEDTQASILEVHSDDLGSDCMTDRRPQLTLTWTSGAERTCLEQDVFLEYGRRYRLPRVDCVGATEFAVSFHADEGYESPSIEVRGGKATSIEPWRSATGGALDDWEWMELRVLAARDPHVIGDVFQAAIKDPYVRTAAPEDQDVPWTFVSPTGVVHRVSALYQGEFRWKVSFMPDEIGRWRYRWANSFAVRPYGSLDGVFDVVGGDGQAVRRALAALTERARHGDLRRDKEQRHWFMTGLMRLEREAMRDQTPESYSSNAWDRYDHLLDELRGTIDRSPPDTLEMVGLRPAKWARERAQEAESDLTMLGDK